MDTNIVIFFEYLNNIITFVENNNSMYSIKKYPYLSNLINDLDSYNIYFTEKGIESIVYGRSILLCEYHTNKPRIRLLGYKEVQFKRKTNGIEYIGLEIDFFGGPTIYLTFEEELVIFEYSDIQLVLENESFA